MPWLITLESISYLENVLISQSSCSKGEVTKFLNILDFGIRGQTLSVAVIQLEPQEEVHEAIASIRHGRQVETLHSGHRGQRFQQESLVHTAVSGAACVQGQLTAAPGAPYSHTVASIILFSGSS